MLFLTGIVSNITIFSLLLLFECTCSNVLARRRDELKSSKESPQERLLEDETPCLQSCSAFPEPLSADLLQTCVSQCQNAGHCCGNRLNGEAPVTSNQRGKFTITTNELYNYMDAT